MNYAEAQRAAQRLAGKKAKLKFYRTGRGKEQRYELINDGCSVASGATFHELIERYRERVERHRADAAERERIRLGAAAIGRVSRAAVLREIEAKCPDWHRLEYAKAGASRPWVSVQFKDGRYHTVDGESWAEVPLSRPRARHRSAGQEAGHGHHVRRAQVTREQADRVVEALASSDLETIRAVRDTVAVVDTALLTLRSRLATIETDRQRAIVKALGEADTK